MKNNDHPRVTLRELPTLIRMARRGRTFEEAGAEAELDATTLRKAEAGVDVSLQSVKKIAWWTKHGITVEPDDLHLTVDSELVEEEGESE